jgi:hypothetical protein
MVMRPIVDGAPPSGVISTASSSSCWPPAEPVEAFLVPGSTADVTALRAVRFDLPEGSTVYADAAFTWHELEDVMAQAANIHLMPRRKANSTRPLPPCTAYLQARGRKIIETVGSRINRLMPKHIHAVTAQGFELKVMLFVLAYALERFLPQFGAAP